MKAKRILAFTGALLLLGLYGGTLILALLSSPLSRQLLKASVACTVILPILLYGYILVYRTFGKGSSAPEEDLKDNTEKPADS